MYPDVDESVEKRFTIKSPATQIKPIIKDIIFIKEKILKKLKKEKN